MADTLNGNHVIGLNMAEVITGFRDYYVGAEQACELDYVSLVSRHDSSLLFTNSTTSVMKPYLTSGTIDETHFLVQPAMGGQGIDAWIKTGHIGPYASYFHSMGAMYSHEKAEAAITDAQVIATQRWGISEAKVAYWVDQSDEDVIQQLERTGLQFEVVSPIDKSPYRHHYGVDGLAGRNANLMNLDGQGVAKVLGNLTIIESHGRPNAWEVSFDSPTVLMATNELAHPIEAFPLQGLDDVQDQTHRLIMQDAATVAGALFMEGLEPKSRGRNGVMRKFFKTLVSLGHDYDLSNNDIGEVLEQAIAHERTARNHLGSSASSTDHPAPQMVAALVTKWLNRNT